MNSKEERRRRGGEEYQITEKVLHSLTSPNESIAADTQRNCAKTKPDTLAFWFLELIGGFFSTASRAPDMFPLQTEVKDYRLFTDRCEIRVHFPFLLNKHWVSLHTAAAEWRNMGTCWVVCWSSSFPTANRERVERREARDGLSGGGGTESQVDQPRVLKERDHRWFLPAAVQSALFPIHHKHRIYHTQVQLNSTFIYNVYIISNFHIWSCLCLL